MAWLRLIAYFAGFALLLWFLTALEVAYPGSLRLQEFRDASDAYGTSEYSPVEILQSLFLLVCGLIMAQVAERHASQRPLAIPFGGLALAYLIRENDYFLDRYIATNFWPVLIAVAGALVIAYGWRQRRRLNIALARLWPSPALTLMFAGALVLFVFVRLIGQEVLWQAILGDSYQRIVKLAVEEFVELLGYMLWLAGAAEYWFQVRDSAVREPQPAAVRRRQTLLGRRG